MVSMRRSLGHWLSGRCRRMAWTLAATAAVCLAPGAGALSEPPVDRGVAWKEMLEFLSNFEAGSEETGFRICFVGHEALTLEMALQLLVLPEPYATMLPHPLNVALMRQTAVAVEELQEQVELHGERLLVFGSEDPRLPPGGSGCSAVILAAFAARPYVDLSFVSWLLSREAAELPRHRFSSEEEGVAMLGHFGAFCGPGDHGCRSVHANWRDASGGAGQCGSHFCGAAVTREALLNVHLPTIDCMGMTGGSALSEASQWQQDWFVYKNFVEGTHLDVNGNDESRGDRQGVFVDVGAFHPIHLSNTYFFERCLGWRGLCVEPNPSMHGYFETYRPACELVKHCVWSRPRKVVMSFQKDPIEAYIREDEGQAPDAEPAPDAGVSGAVKITGSGKRPEFTAECRTLEDILRSRGLQKPATVDFLSVDAEAAEVEIFKDFPFDDFDIKVINVEVQAYNYYELDAVILNAGYAKISVLGGDHVYAKLNSPLVFPSRMAEWRKALAENFWVHEAPRTATALNGRAGGPDANS